MNDIARAANASVTTVGRVIHNNGYVSSEVRARVEKAISDLGYVPNQSARILKSRKLIAVSRPELKQTFLDMKMDYAETLEEAWEKAKAIAGEDCSVNLIPDGISVIVE